MEIHTDHGSNSESELFKEMCEWLEIGKTRTTSYRPYANGQVELYNRSIAQMIRCCIGNRQERCDDFVGIVVGAIRATVNRSTGFTPNRMVLGREVMMPLDLMLGNEGEGVIFLHALNLTWQLKNILSSHPFSPLIKQLTREIQSSNTIIDNIYGNIPCPFDMRDVGILRLI